MATNRSPLIGGPPTVVEAPPPPPTKVKVTVKIIAIEARASVMSTHVLPSANAVANVLPMPHRRQANTFLKRHGGQSTERIIWYLRESIPTSVWTKAIINATIAALQCGQVTESTLETTHALNEAYLASGDQVYRLSCIGMTGTNKALAVVRRRAMDAAKIEADKIIAKATKDGQLVIQNSNREAEAIYVRALTKESEANALMRGVQSPPPAWAIGVNTPNGGRIPIYTARPESTGSKTHPHHVGFFMPISVTKFTFTDLDRSPGRTADAYITKTWAPVANMPKAYILIWLPVARDGTFNITSAYVDASCAHIPHVNTANACMTPSSMPPRLSSVVEYHAMWSAIQSTLSEVVLNSLLVNIQNWCSGFKAFCPAPLAAILMTADYKERLRQFVVDTNTPGVTQNIVTPAQEAATTWTIPTAAPTTANQQLLNELAALTRDRAVF
jgi:hypothetical protein